MERIEKSESKSITLLISPGMGIKAIPGVIKLIKSALYKSRTRDHYDISTRSASTDDQRLQAGDSNLSFG